MEKNTLGIIGAGEVGSAIKQLATGKFQVFSRDLNFDEISGEKVDVLHLSFPYSDKFVGIATNTIKELHPSLVIIDSTVKPGTTRKIFDSVNTPIAHTPIMGVHPNLADYQKVFSKVIGAIDEDTYRSAEDHWKILGADKLVKFDGPEESELAKVLSTTYYGWNIVFNKAAKRVSDKHGTNFDQVYSQFNQVYNQGYKDTHPQVIRPILKHVEGEIGGHCVLPNASFMNDELFTVFADLAKKFSE